jgi:hypothetical protein
VSMGGGEGRAPDCLLAVSVALAALPALPPFPRPAPSNEKFAKALLTTGTIISPPTELMVVSELPGQA